MKTTHYHPIRTLLVREAGQPDAAFAFFENVKKKTVPVSLATLLTPNSITDFESELTKVAPSGLLLQALF